MEIWKPVVGHEAYEVSNEGRVRTAGQRSNGRPNGLVMKPGLNLRGYHQIMLMDRKRYTVHLLVMQAFVGPRPDGAEINHKNGIKTDNSLDNLEYCTKSENSYHAQRVLGKGRGETHGMSKLTDDKVREIRRLAAQGMPQRKIAARFGLTHPNVGFIVRRATWAHVTD